LRLNQKDLEALAVKLNYGLIELLLEKLEKWAQLAPKANLIFMLIPVATAIVLLLVLQLKMANAKK
jgi:hypothetical protein